MASPNFVALEWIFDSPTWTQEVLATPLAIHDGLLDLPARPGLDRARSRGLRPPSVPTGRLARLLAGRWRRCRLVSSGLPAELERVAESMRRHRLDFLLLASPSNVTYVAGFEAPIPVGFVADVTGWLPAVALVSSDGSGSLLLNDADAGGARARSWWPDVRTFETLGQTEAADPRESFSHALTAALQATGLGTRYSKAVVGVEPTLPRVAAEVLAAECPQAELRDATGAIEDARRTKTPREIELLRRAVAVADEGQRRLLEASAAGASGPTNDIGLWSEATGAMERLSRGQRSRCRVRS